MRYATYNLKLTTYNSNINRWQVPKPETTITTTK